MTSLTGEVKKILKANMKKKASSQGGGGGAHPLHPPPRPAPEEKHIYFGFN